MGFFSRRVERPKRTAIDIFDFDLLSLPDESFKIDKIHTDETKTYYIKIKEDGKYLNIFSWLTVIVFNNSNSKNFIFKCFAYEFDKYDLPELILKIFNIYGNDDSKRGIYTRNDANEIDENMWSGRDFTSDRFTVACSLDYDDDEGLTFTIWTT